MIPVTRMVALLAILGLGAACALWIVLQRWIARMDPEQPGVEGSKGCGMCRAAGASSAR